ncbi:hypothetical protein [Legionella waltersii]|uniref:Transmembrane protein n=1 Tax=Legionella waltersii TaxID=66969 RepID=A0A0W1A5A6_9GAMM|nr:hypothetical protein [Legionella waltersii]KTD76546.1 hypothetical protein Lwal_2268 [Legionella waltersii]SNU94043.1 Uncharacterised protein [Legionella waltersii]
MEMTTKDQNKLAAIYAPLLVFIACFIVIVFSISQIIGMAKSVARASQVQSEQYNFASVNSLIQSSSPINYKEFKTKLSESFQNESTFQAELNIDPQIEKLPITEQNYLIRLKLIEWKTEQIQDQISKILSTPSESLIFKAWFWVYSLLIWASSIVGGQILTFHTNKLIYRCWGKSGEKIYD